MPGPNGAPYVTYTQLSNYCPAATLNLATVAQQQQACIDATNDADDYMNGRYAMPLLAWPSSITDHTAYMAIYKLMTGPIGLAPQAGSDVNFERNFYRAVGWPDRPGTGYFPGIQAQRIHPAVTPSVPVGQDPGHDAPQVSSNQPRGWQQFNARGRPVVGGF
jgi:hypothetical protein